MKWTVVAAAGLLMGSSAFAEEMIVEEHRESTVMLKGGLGDYTGASSLNVGPVWGVALGMQPWSILGFEVAYDGSLNTVTGSGSVVRNGANAMLKLSPPFMFRVRPFIGGGLGASVVSTVNATSAYGGGLMGEVPLAAGLEFNTRYMSAGIRATYRVLAGNTLANNGNFFDGAATVGGWF